MNDASKSQHSQFLRLYAEHESAIHVFVRSMLPSREEASEVMQEVVVVLWSKFDEAEDFRKWAFGVARLEVLKFLQSRKRERCVFDMELVERLADRAEQTEGVEMRREALDGCLQKLPASQRELVLTAYTKGNRIDDVAARQGRTSMALYKQLHRIRMALMSCIERSLAKEKYV